MIALADAALRGDLDPGLGERDDCLSDRSWEASQHLGVRYTRWPGNIQALDLHRRGFKPKAICERVGLSQSSVYSWMKTLNSVGAVQQLQSTTSAWYASAPSPWRSAL